MNEEERRELRKKINQKRFDALNDMSFCARPDGITLNAQYAWISLTDQEKWDVIEGRCKMSSYQNVPILDYSIGE